MTTMQHHRLPFARHTRHHDRRSSERRSGGSPQGVLAAVMTLALCACVVLVQQEAPELDASTARESLAVLDDMLAAGGGEQH